MAEEYVTYKGFPLVRMGNQIYYGNMGDETVTWLNVTSTHKEGELEVADKIKVTLMRTAMFTDKSFDPKDAVVKTSDRESLYEALDVANIWLTR